MAPLLRLLPAVLWFLPAGLLVGQESTRSRLDSPQYEAEAARLRAMSPRPYEIRKAVLSDVVQFLATEAGLTLSPLPKGSPEAERLITFSLKASPFQALETICKANGLSLILDGGVLYVRTAIDTELVGRDYEIKRGGPVGPPAATTVGAGVASAGVNTQGAGEPFNIPRTTLIDDIRAILDLPAESVHDVAVSDPLIKAENSAGRDAEARQAFKNPPSPVAGGNNRKQAIWKSDSSTLYIVATRLQHKWVEGYLTGAKALRNPSTKS